MADGFVVRPAAVVDTDGLDTCTDAVTREGLYLARVSSPGRQQGGDRAVPVLRFHRNRLL